MSLRSFFLACAIATLSAAAVAQATEAEPAASAPAAAELAPVAVTAVRDPAMLPYPQIAVLLRFLEQHGQGLFRLDLRIRVRDPAKPHVEPITLTLLQGERETQIPVATNGRIVLPVLSADDAKGAELASNQPKGTLKGIFILALTTPPADLDLATVRHIVAAGGTLRAALPWYLRILSPKIDAVLVCSRRAAWSMQWTEGEQLMSVALPADPSKHDDSDPDDVAAKSRVCTVLTGQEPWPASARLVADPDTTLIAD